MKKIAPEEGFTNFLRTIAVTKTLIFDLDNTIYKEINFLFRAYRNIAVEFGKRYTHDPDDIYSFLTGTFYTEGRVKLFDKLRLYLKISDNMFVESCLAILRNTVLSPPINPFKYFTNYVRAVPHQPIFIITNGNPLQQKNKIRSLHWENKNEVVAIYANLFVPKPDPASFFFLRENYNLKDPIYIGDTLEDSLFAKRCGMGFIKVFDPVIM